MSTLVNPRLVDEIGGFEEFDADACMNCGVCTAICPMGIDLLPRQLFRYVLLGLEDRVVAETETVYSCLLCKMCEESCPAGVHIAENVRSLRHYLNRRVFGIGEASMALADRRRDRDPRRQPAPARVGAADLAPAGDQWTRGLDLPRGGETVLYTGLMYQLVPSIEALVDMEQRVAGTPLARLTGLGRRVNRFVNVSAPVVIASGRKRAVYDRVLRDVAVLLREAGVEFGYLYEDDLYSGALGHDLGLDEIVAEHARRVAAVFRRHGVKRVITVDPHTTNMLRSVYPGLVEGYDLEVRSYLEVLAELQPAVRTTLAGELALHDSCVYARYENVVEEPRALLARTGLSIREPEHSGRRTWCCGGPVESLYPEKAVANARTRVAELRRAAPAGVTMCPLCLVNLSAPPATRCASRTSRST